MSTLEHRTSKEVLRGDDYPRGATPTPDGVNFVLESERADEVWLLLFERPDGEPTDVIRLEHRTRRRWHAMVAGVGPGQLYGYKVRGPWDPARGLRFNEHKLLVDPYAKALTGTLRNVDGVLLGHDADAGPDADLVMDRRDSTAVVPKAVVVDDRFDWAGDRPPRLPLSELVIYEVHLKGFTAHPSSGVRHPGTYLGFAEKAEALRSLGVNAVELLPVHDSFTEDRLSKLGLTNYWGYNTVTFFAPAWAYSTQTAPGCQVTEFKTMVRELHRAGIEVILDVVFNHTCESDELGPTVSLRGIDNPAYYRLEAGRPWEPGRLYVNHTGCGNTLDLTSPRVIRLVMDSLRYWAAEMHVDGFRFDLASVLGRVAGGFDRSAAFFHVVAQDPVLSRVKLIAEPWDLGTYQVGNFPEDWSEWNGRFRDVMRRFARGDRGQAQELGARLTGSSDLFGRDGRSPYDSVNFVTCHDGFTLNDLVSYDRKHNEANLDDNRDGTDDNTSWNCGVEGETEDPAVLELRDRLVRNHVCHLLFSLGTPMLLGGDEVLRTQRGNNNAYCQDGELTWHDWSVTPRQAAFREFVRKAIAFRRRNPILGHRSFRTGLDTDGDQRPDIAWYGRDGGPPAWGDPGLRTLCYQLDCSEVCASADGELLFFVLNASPRAEWIALPAPEPGTAWRRVVDTSLPPGLDFVDPGEEVLVDPPEFYIANARSTVVLLAR
jgi:glycogen operon protein